MMNFLSEKYVKMINAFDAMRKDEKGQGLVEYALIIVCVALLVIVALKFLGGTVGNTYCRAAGALS